MVRMLCAAVSVFVVCLSVRADEKKENPDVALLKARLEAQAKELEALRKQVKELEDGRTKLILAKEAAQRESLLAQNAEKLARAVADENAKKIEELMVAIQKLKEPNAGDSVAPKPREKGTPAEQFRGTVERAEASFVQINIGVDVGLEPGLVLDVFRADDKTGKYLGTVKITKVYPKEAVGTFTPASRAPVSKLKPDELPRKGDTVCSPITEPRK